VGLVEHNVLDLFVIGGGNPQKVLQNYRRLTGFPANVPLWSYGTWMSRMSYWTAEQTLEVARKMREGNFPCDVIHLDTGWFNEDWKCDWQFSKEKYPDPAGYFRPEPYETARAKGYVPHGKVIKGAVDGSNFSGEGFGGTIDFTNPEAVRWYQGMLENLLKLGASAIKTDFGEEIDMNFAYHAMQPEMLHNLYALLYQKAAFEITQQTTGEGIIWARSSWIGSQQYPVHWGGDCGCTYDGLAGTIRGGLHFGVSGFAFWSHDVPGFHATICTCGGRRSACSRRTCGITGRTRASRTSIRRSRRSCGSGCGCGMR
jgi:alpha-D-xyloside xylohydrolase